MWKKANAKIGILAKKRCFITEKTAMKIYKCMIRPHLDYIDSVVESGSADRIQKLDTLQKKAIRRIEYCMAPETNKVLMYCWKNTKLIAYMYDEKEIC